MVPDNAVSLTVFHLINSIGSLTVDNFSLTEAVVNGGFDQGFVSLNFDDGWLVTFQNALPILNAAGLKSTQYIITDGFQDTAEYVSPAQVLAMQASGHEIGAHTKSHPHLISLNDSQIQDEVVGSRDVLLAAGVNSVTTLDYPYGEYNPAVVNIVKNSGFTGARTVDDGFNIKTDDPYLLKAEAVTEASTTIDQIKGWIDSAKADKTWLILVFHQIDHSGDEYSATPELLQQIVDYLVQQNVPVKTNAEGISELTP
jgi:peptidoglycan/xylan/chitin deacetylase (PgdA/CDA1 family)